MLADYNFFNIIINFMSKLKFRLQLIVPSNFNQSNGNIHTEKCLVGFTIRWLIQLHDLISYKATTYLVVVTISDSCNDLGNTTIRIVTLPIMGSYSYY